VKPPKVYYKPMILPRVTGREHPNERVIEVRGFQVDEGCFISIIEGSSGLAIHIYGISSDHVSVAVENRLADRRTG
jgi:hypothetical protein